MPTGVDAGLRSATSEDRPIVVVGAGPHGLTVCAYLLRARPDWRNRLLVVDPLGWLEAWDAKLARLEIDVLRSPCVHHPDPEPYALLDFGRSRPGQMVGRYQSPTTRLFAEFCQALIERHRLDTALVRDRVTAVDVSRDGSPRLTLAGGDRIDAEAAIVATNPCSPVIPAWAQELPVVHASAVDLAATRRGERVVVIGGGLTAAQISLAAMHRQARVTLLCRAKIRRSTADADPRWLGHAYLGPYLAEPDWNDRAARYHAARKGTMPPTWAERLRGAVQLGNLDIHERCSVASLQRSGTTWTLDTARGPLQADRVWLATGWRHDASEDRLLGPLLRTGGAIMGLPILDTACRLPGTRVHVTGALAALQVGAFAPNLAGARIAAERIVGSLTALSDRQYPNPHERETPGPMVPTRVSADSG